MAHNLARVVVAVDLTGGPAFVAARLAEFRAVGAEELLLAWPVDLRRCRGMARGVQRHHLARLEKEAGILREMGFRVACLAPLGFPWVELAGCARDERAILVAHGYGAEVGPLIRWSGAPVLFERKVEAEGGRVSACRAFCGRRFDSVLLVVDPAGGGEEADWLRGSLGGQLRRVVFGPAGADARELCRVAEEEDVGLVVLRVREAGRGFSVSEAARLVRLSRRPVLVLPAAAG